MADWRLTLNGLTIGEDTLYRWAEKPKFSGGSTRVADTPRPGAWGDVSNGRDLASARDLLFKVFTDTDDQEHALALLEAFQGAWQPCDDVALEIERPDRTGLVYGRPRDDPVVDLEDVRQGFVTIAARFRALDPRLYDAVASVAGSGMATSTGGLVFPLVFPLTFGSILPGEAAVANDGNTPTFLAALAIPAPGLTIVSPSWELVETGERLSLPGLTVPAGQYLGIDWKARTAVLTSDLSNPTVGVDVANWIDRTASSWWTGPGELPAGSSTVRFAGTGGVGACLYSWRSAWML